MLPVRLVLNITYADIVRGMDGKQREEFDAKLYGFDVASREATNALMRG